MCFELENLFFSVVCKQDMLLNKTYFYSWLYWMYKLIMKVFLLPDVTNLDGAKKASSYFPYEIIQKRPVWFDEFLEMAWLVVP